jgi:geranylgeranyl transferase type-1 subunit beta
MYLGFFIISALDLLSAYQPSTDDAERQDHLNWIYRCQHPQGGFRMWPGTNFEHRASPENAKWDPANMPATYFALATLLILGDDFERVRRKETMDWLRRMQRHDGSFGETFVDGRVEGGRDPRFGYCAMGIRYILRGGLLEDPVQVDGEVVADVNIDAFVRCIKAAVAYDGGIADELFHEPHAGYTYCALGAVDLAGRLQKQDPREQPLRPETQEEQKVMLDPARTLQWLVFEQTDWIDPDDDDPNDEIAVDCRSPAFLSQDRNEGQSTYLQSAPESLPLQNSEPLHQSAATSTFTPIASSQVLSSTPICAAGFCGRPHKPADTCYAWWVCGSLHLLPGGSEMYNRPALRQYLLEKTQHPVLGGFSKFPGDPPDLYHSYLGLAACALERDEMVKVIDAGMCISSEARERIGRLWG